MMGFAEVPEFEALLQVIFKIERTKLVLPG
jgi:hypothetical protein